MKVVDHPLIGGKKALKVEISPIAASPEDIKLLTCGSNILRHSEPPQLRYQIYIIYINIYFNNLVLIV
jgi:hypothetical protein